MEQSQIQRILEAILFASGERMEITRLAAAVGVESRDIEDAANALADRLAYERRGIRIIRLERGYQMVSSGEMADYVTRALETRKPPKLSSSQLEALTIIASGSRRLVRNPVPQGWYPNSDSDKTGVLSSSSPTYPVHAVPNPSIKLE